MPTTPPDDVAAMFDLPPLPATAPPSAESIEAAEAALAAEFAAAMDDDGVAIDAPDSRCTLRVAVSWPARLRTPDGRVVPLRVRNVSEVGVGLVSQEHVPAHTAVDFEMDVPSRDGSGAASVVVRGTIRTTYTVVQQGEVFCGGTWEGEPSDKPLLNAWIEALRR